MGELMMPGKEREYISRETILAWFGVTAETGLFPTPNDFKNVPDPIWSSIGIQPVAARKSIDIIEHYDNNDPLD